MLWQPAGATPAFVDVFQKAYTVKPGGKLDNAAKQCSLCHAKAGPPKLNSYGDAIKGVQHDKTKLTAEELKSIEALDSDGDLFPNGAELKADTLPGDPSSKPDGPPPAAVTTAPSNAPPPVAKSTEPTSIWSLRSMILPKHAQHRVIVHFPVALLVISVVFEFLAAWKQNKHLVAVAYYNMIMTLVTSPIAIITGLLAWWFDYGGMAFTANTNLLYHLITGLVTTLLAYVMWYMRFKQGGANAPFAGKGYLFLGLIAILLIAISGHLGGALVVVE